MTARLRAITSLLALGLSGGCQTGRVDERSFGEALGDRQGPSWAPYAAYLRSAIARVQKQWESELIGSRVAPRAGTSVTVVFWLSAEGKVSRIEEVNGESDGFGAKACLSAITRLGTFGPWTDEMKQRLAVEEKLTFTFHYEK